MSYNKREIKVTDRKQDKSNPFKKDIIYDPMGQWAHPGQPTRIPGGNITMAGVPYPVMGIADTGQQQMMMPGQNYSFPGAQYVDELPMAQRGGTYEDSLYLYNRSLREKENYENFLNRFSIDYSNPSRYRRIGLEDDLERWAERGIKPLYKRKRDSDGTSSTRQSDGSYDTRETFWSDEHGSIDLDPNSRAYKFLNRGYLMFPKPTGITASDSDDWGTIIQPPPPKLDTKPLETIEQRLPGLLPFMGEEQEAGFKPPKSVKMWKQDPNTGTWYQIERPVRPEYLSTQKVGFYADGGYLPMAQDGYADSLFLYNNSVDLEDWMKRNKYTIQKERYDNLDPRADTTEGLLEIAKDIYNEDKSWEGKLGRSKDIYEYIKRRGNFVGSSDWGALAGDDYGLPFTWRHPTIKPQYQGDMAPSSFQGPFSYTYSYDPLAIKPSNLLSDKEIIKRYKLFGASGIPESRLIELGVIEDPSPIKLDPLPVQTIEKALPDPELKLSKRNEGTVKPPKSITSWHQDPRTGTWFQRERPVVQHLLPSEKIGFVGVAGQEESPVPWWYNMLPKAQSGTDTDYFRLSPASLMGQTPGLETYGQDRLTMDATFGRSNFAPRFAKRAGFESIGGNFTARLPYQNNTGVGVQGNVKFVGDRWKAIQDKTKANTEMDFTGGYDPVIGGYGTFTASPQFTFGNVSPTLAKVYQNQLGQGEWIAKAGPYAGVGWTPGREKTEETFNIPAGVKGQFNVGIGGGKTLGASGYFGGDVFGQASSNYGDPSGLKGRTQYGFDVNLTIPFGRTQKRKVGEAFTKIYDKAFPEERSTPSITGRRSTPSIFQQGGDFEEQELTDAEIADLRAQGYVVEELPKAQEGTPTYADSLALYNNALAKEAFYRNNMNDYEFNDPALSPPPLFTKEVLLEAANQTDREREDASTYRSGRVTPEISLDRIKQVSPNVFSTTDFVGTIGHDLFYNIDAPPILYSPYILPQGTVEASSMNTGDWTTIPWYDPVMVKPWNMLTDEEREYRRKVEKEGYTFTNPFLPKKEKPEEKPKGTTDPNISVSVRFRKMGLDSSFANRKKIAQEMAGIEDYKGTSEQNKALNKWIVENYDPETKTYKSSDATQTLAGDTPVTIGEATPDKSFDYMGTRSIEGTDADGNPIIVNSETSMTPPWGPENSKSLGQGIWQYVGPEQKSGQPEADPIEPAGSPDTVPTGSWEIYYENHPQLGYPVQKRRWVPDTLKLSTGTYTERKYGGTIPKAQYGTAALNSGAAFFGGNNAMSDVGPTVAKAKALEQEKEKQKRIQADKIKAAKSGDPEAHYAHIKDPEKRDKLIAEAEMLTNVGTPHGPHDNWGDGPLLESHPETWLMGARAALPFAQRLLANKVTNAGLNAAGMYDLTTHTAPEALKNWYDYQSATTDDQRRAARNKGIALTGEMFLDLIPGFTADRLKQLGRWNKPKPSGRSLWDENMYVPPQRSGYGSFDDFDDFDDMSRGSLWDNMDDAGGWSDFDDFEQGVTNTFKKKSRGWFDENKDITIEDFEDAVNQQLVKGLGIKKLPGSLSTRLNAVPHKSNIEDFNFALDYNNKHIGNVGITKESFSSPRRGFYKSMDYPYEIAEDSKQFYGSGISGEFNKALTNALQQYNYNRLGSSDIHSDRGLQRWKSLVSKNLAGYIPNQPDRFELFKKGGDYNIGDEITEEEAMRLRALGYDIEEF